MTDAAMPDWMGQSRLKPETAEEAKDAETIEGKRRRLRRFARVNALTKAVFMAAEHQGLSGDDTMTWLAYEALLLVEQLEQRMLHDIMRSPTPPMIFPTSVLQTEPPPK